MTRLTRWLLRKRVARLERHRTTYSLAIFELDQRIKTGFGTAQLAHRLRLTRELVLETVEKINQIKEKLNEP